MAIRVRINITTAEGRRLETVAILNGGFEVPEPHLLLPAACAERLFEDFRKIAARQDMIAAGGLVEFHAISETVQARVYANDREGPDTTFRVLVSEAEGEVLVSDLGIDALGIRIETFNPPRWRFADENQVRETEPPQYW